MPELVKLPRYKVGDQLQLKLRGPRWVGTVTEARGTFSPDGHVLYRVRVPMDPEPLFLLVREEEVADPNILGKLAEEVRHLMESPKARERFRTRSLEYLRERADNSDRPPPVDLVRAGKSAELTLAEKYALLAALYNALRASSEEFDPINKPGDVSWEEFSARNPQEYTSALRWAALENRVKEWLGPEKASEIQRWLDAVQKDLHNKGRSSKIKRGGHK
jgi:hypothetical protein